ncbi:MAG: putative lipid II flippase FtsW [Chloroflexi bacterium]|nr:putative lipid II flippase FtsW [Chloroflexota bacterium]
MTLGSSSGSAAVGGQALPRPQLRPPDLILFTATVLLLAVGAVMVYSASFVIAHNEFQDDLYFLSRHLGAIALGAVAMVVLVRIDYRRWRRFSLLVMLGCVALLILVLAPGVGSRVYGAVRWIKVGPIQIQPSELAKIAIALYLADWLARRGPLVKHMSSGSLPFVIIVGVVAGLVEMQPDLGTTFVIVGTAASVFFIAGANLWHVALAGGIGMLAGIAAIARMSGYRQDRITAFLDPWADLQGSGWHTAQTLIALGSGGPFGLGLGGSRQKFYWVPNAHTDAIFSIIGEELGFVGTLAVLVVFGVVAWRGFVIAWQAPDTFGRLLAAGLTSGLVIQALVNIAVVTNSIPYTGVPLPFISYGGSSTIISMVAVGFLLSISRRRGLPRETDHSFASAPQPVDGRMGPTRRLVRGAPAAASRIQAIHRAWVASRVRPSVADALQARPARRRVPRRPALSHDGSRRARRSPRA